MTHPVITDVTNRIAIRSADQRGTYLERMVAAAENGPARGRLACANLAHGFAASDTRDNTDMKFFPAEAAGGVPYLRAIQSPVPSARFCPTGGITPMNIAEYLKTPNVGCVGGSWLTPSDAVDRRDWSRISSLATVALELAGPTPEPLGGDTQ